MVLTKQLQKSQNNNDVFNASTKSHLFTVSKLVLVVFCVLNFILKPFSLLLQLKQIFVIFLNVLLQFFL